MATTSEEHVQLLSLFHYVLAGVTALFSLMPLIHVALGVAMLNGAFDGSAQRGPPPPAWMGWIFVVMGGAFILAGLTFAALLAVAGRSLAQRRRWLYCTVVAALACMCMPLGTVLGVFTLVVLQKQEVQALFGRRPPIPTVPPPPPAA